VVETPQNAGETGTDEGLVEKTSRLLACFGGGVLLCCCVLVSLDVISRKLFNIVPFFSFELTGYGFGLAIALGYSYALLSKAHIRVNALYIHFPPAVRIVLDIVALAVLSAVVGSLAFYAVIVAHKSFELDAVSNTTLAMPLVIPQAIWAMGLLWFAFTCIFLLVKAVGLWIRRRGDEVSRLIGALDRT
jgi:TRAP-type C4-dicarboxylate transport system permease small subunit